MINLKNLDKWQHLVGGEMISFSNPNPRMVRIEVNAPFETRLYVTQDAGEPVFLALVTGLNGVSFGVNGAFTLYGDGDFSVYSAEMESVAFHVLDPVIFTEIANRRARNPELEYVTQKMQENMERRLAQVSRGFEAALQEMHQNANYAPAPAPSSATPEPKPDPKPVVPGPAPVDPVGADPAAAANVGAK